LPLDVECLKTLGPSTSEYCILCWAICCCAHRDADEVDVKEDPLEGHILPYGPDGQPVPKVQLAYAQGKAMDAFRLILNDCSIEECKQV
jgi:hypothetical protein